MPLGVSEAWGAGCFAADTGSRLASAGVVVIPRMRGVGELREKDVVPAVTQMTTGQGRSKRADTQGRRPRPVGWCRPNQRARNDLRGSAGWLKRCFLADRP